MIRATFACLLVACAVVAPAMAQPNPSQQVGTSVADTGVPGYRFESFRLESSDGQRAYRVRVALPLQADPSGHPVAYLLDGNAALMEVDADLLGRLAQAPRPPAIVFIGYDNALRIDAESRAFDYTPRRPGGDAAQQDVTGGRRNGGADAFLDLIEDGIAPRVQAMARMDPARRALWGHSYGGVFVLHALFTRPQAFSLYAPVDPSLWWGNGYLLQAQARAKPAPGVALWVMSGDAPGTGHRAPPAGRDPQTVEAMRRARQAVPANATHSLIQTQQVRGLHAEHTVLQGLSHGQTLGASLPLLLQRLAATEPSP